MSIFGSLLVLYFVGSHSLFHKSLIVMFFSSSYPIFAKNLLTSNLRSQTLSILKRAIEKQKIVCRLSKFSSDMSLMKRIISKRGGIRREYISPAYSSVLLLLYLSLQRFFFKYFNFNWISYLYLIFEMIVYLVFSFLTILNKPNLSRKTKLKMFSNLN